MKNILIKYKVEIIFIGYSIAAIGLLYSGFIPYKNKVESQAEKIQETTLENLIFENKTSRISQMEAKYNDYQNNKGKMGKFLKDGEEVELIKRIESLGEETQNRVALNIAEEKKDSSSSSVKNAAKEESIPKDISSQNYLNLEINLEGSYDSFIDFLKKMESLDYYIDVVSLDLAKTDAKDSSASVFSDNIFSSRQADSAPPVEKEILKSKIGVIVFKN
jgi:hypothetical protein